MTEATQAGRVGGLLDRAKLARLADHLAVAVAVSLPWSTSATSILVPLWVFAMWPTLDLASVRRVLATPAGALPVALWALGVIGMLWADVSFAERVDALGGFHKLLVIPLLLIQFERSHNGTWVIAGFLASCTLLLIASYASAFFPVLADRWRVPAGIPVKNYVVQSGEFLLCAFALCHLSFNAWDENRRVRALMLAALALVFVINTMFVATSRAMLLVIPVLVVLLGWQRMGWKGTVAFLVGGAVLAGTAWASSPYLRSRVLGVIQEVQDYRTDSANTSAGYRLEFWKKSVGFVAAAPLIGHGTGSIEEQFRRAATGNSIITTAVTQNPHNQTLVIAIQLGLVGVVVLYAMWITQLCLFWQGSLPAWLGTGVVLQIMVASLFDSQIFYFTPGWIYVFGVGVLGGMVFRSRRSGTAAEARPVGGAGQQSSVMISDTSTPAGTK